MVSFFLRFSCPFSMSKEIDIFFGVDADDCMAMYLREISCTPLLEARDEIILGRTIQDGIKAREKLENNGSDTNFRLIWEKKVEEGIEAEEIMINANLWLVVSIAKKFQGRGVPLSDLIQSGNEGLVKKTKDFDPSLGYRFSTYITPWIQKGITDATREQGGEVRMTRSMAIKVTRLGRVEKRLKQAGEEPTMEKLAKESGLSVNKVKEAITFPWSALSFDELNKKDPGVPVCDIVEEKILVEEAKKEMENFDPREKAIIELHNGLSGELPLSRTEIGKKFNITYERVRQLETRTLEELNLCLSRVSSD